MKIVNFKGGLENQISIFLFSKWLKEHNPSEHIYGAYWSGALKEHNDFMLDKIFDITLPPSSLLTDIISKIALWLEIHHIVSTEEDEHSIFYNGYWLDKQYFGDYWHYLRFKDIEMTPSNLQFRKMIEDSNSCSIHIRRGDYQSPENKSKFGDYCTLDYYKAAVREINKRSSSKVKFFIFSDDLQWTIDNMPLNDAVFISGNKGNNSWLDMYLMSLCKNNIIANSTFSFWAAMLNKHPEKMVIYPKKWYIWENPDIFPEQWLAL